MSDSIVSVRSATIQFGGPNILDKVSFEIHSGERIALIGRNGEGKVPSSNYCSGFMLPDSGEIYIRPDKRVSCLSQEVDPDLKGPVLDIVIDGLGGDLHLIKEYQLTLQKVETDSSLENLDRLSELEEQLTRQNLWDTSRLAESILSQLGLPQTEEFTHLSTGLKRRVLLGACSH